MRGLRKWFVLWAVLAGRAEAQSAGRITGVIQTAAGEPVAGAWVAIASLTTTLQSREDGTFTILRVPDGTYNLRVYRIGYRLATVTGVVVRARAATPVVVLLEPTPIMLDAVVASVSRHAEAITDAPASITSFDSETIASGLGSPVTRLLQRAPGIDLTQVGVMSSFVNGRGFNRAFNSRWLTLEDGRVAAFPETGLPIGEHTPIPKIDLADVEVIAGPGSALYGANASGGLLSVTTRDPRRSPGLALEISGGTQHYSDIQGRYAWSRGRWGFKLAAQRQAARDWADTVRYPAVTPGGSAVPEVPRDLGTHASRVDGSVRYYLGGDDAYVALNVAGSLRDALGHSTNGRYRISGYRYQTAQLVVRSPRWFVQAYTAHSNSGNTYRLSTMTQIQASSPGLSSDSARALAAFPVDGRLLAVEVQNSERIGAHLRTGLGTIDNSRVTWGIQARRDRVDSYSRLYTDAATGRPIDLDQRAFYVMLESRPLASLRFVGAARYDTHSRYASRWSPKVGLLLDLAPGQVLRLTYNGAFLAPSIFQSDVYVLVPAAHVATLGNSDGFDVRDSSGALLNTVRRIRPEINHTWEMGYKGVLGTNLFVDAAAYYARVSDFMALAAIANPYAASATFGYNHRTGQRIEDAAGNPLQVLTFINVGEGRVAGLDAAVRYYLNDRVSVLSATSLSHVIAIDLGPNDPPEAAAFNSSPLRGSLGVEYADTRRQLSGSVRARYVDGYEFRSGTDWGHIPGFVTLGAAASFRVAALGATVMLQADNILSCIGGTSTPPATGISVTSQATYLANRSCGFGIRHHELLNMPAIGATILLGVRREW